MGAERFGTAYRFRDDDGRFTGEPLPVDLAANMRSLGVDVLRADTVDELREALRTARAADRPTAVHVETDPAKKQLPPEAWWDVPVAEVTALESTRAAREQYDHNRRDQRHYL